MRVLVLDGNENQAVACVRSLARAGHEVLVGAGVSWSKAGWSRFASGAFRYVSPEESVGDFVGDVMRESAKAPGTLVLPMTELTTLPLSLHRQRLISVGSRLVLPPHETLLRAFNKRATTQLAASLGVAVPHSTEVGPADSAAEIADAVTYPVVIKAQSSGELNASGRIAFTGRPMYARNPREFVAAVRALRTRCSSLIVQEFVPGTGSGYFALLRHGELIAEFAHRRIRDVRPTGSGSAVRESTAISDRVRSAALPILRALDWHGVAMVEFRMRSDGTPVFLEVNGRFWNSLALAIYAGVDFPALLGRMAQSDEGPPPIDYRSGVRCRWLLGDVRHLIEVWRGAPPSFPGTYPSRLGTLVDVLRPVAGTYHDNFELSDPLPELGDWLNFLIRKLPLQRQRSATHTDSVSDASGRPALP
ncbi:MAG TPA: ATP-grasp domain-containing protein [Gemmatimonadaceae bacterium]|jgi:predicted ATP-grasp superfamily ATP-dependent carboligase